MIINQTIKNGFTVVNKTGAYFSLISAGGVVNVSLSEKGRTVLDTKMWVGMSIDKAIPFDEITIKGDDGAVEFWAGDVSMSQARSSLTGAKAIRTSVKMVLGEVQICGSDITRTAVRVRSNKEIFLGGSGFFGGGWRVPANEVIEVPVAGVVSAYKPDGYIDVSKVTTIGDVSGVWAASEGTSYIWISDDLQQRIILVYPDKDLKISLDGGATYNTFHSNVETHQYDRRTGTHYVLMNNNGTPDIMIVKKSTNLVDWTLVYMGQPDDFEKIWGGWNVFGGSIVGRHLQYVGNGIVFACDIESGKVTTRELDINGEGNAYGAWISDDLKVGVFCRYSGGVYKTEDGGLTWREVLAGAINDTFQAADDGLNLFVRIGNYPYLSNDGGETWVKASTTSWSGSWPVYIKDSLWASHNAGRFHYASIQNGIGKGGYLGNAMTNYGAPSICFSENTGVLTTCRLAGSIAQQVKVVVEGDITAARVEVMELLS
ncbi:hypothetical protein A1L58_14715 [Shewanella baltica]|uniref:WD40/YVTN/BNR-like repeat-containing protein n=1 Tax=Shewanella baltica TaxID=62322 RepID=UPI0007B4A97A|nr:hypothetical protein [Shewanella baltica]KZK70287.1 hypothetical protein A1L58_14715 [Shewanella baltica]